LGFNNGGKTMKMKLIPVWHGDLSKPIQNPPPSVVATVEVRRAWGEALDAWAKAHKVWEKALEACEKTREAREKAWGAWAKAREKALKALTAATADPAVHALHAEQCGCAFDKTKNIFTMEAK